MRVAVCSTKGGVGKTATAANLAAVFGQRGRTLAVDADAQEGLGRAFGVTAGQRDSLAGVLSDENVDVRSAIRSDVAGGVDLLPAHPSLNGVGAALAQQGGLITSIRRALRPVTASYDFVVIDTHGDTGDVTLAAIAAADSVLTVFTSDPGSALGVVRLVSFLNAHRKFENTSAKLLGVACSNWDRESAAGREVVAALAETNLPIFTTRVPFSRRVASATLAKRPVVLRAPGSPVARAYFSLADEALAAFREVLAA
jgi:chromosome partitioning protein